MQRISFVVPASLSTPCAVLVFFLNSRYKFLTTGNADDVVVQWPGLSQMVFGVTWFVSLLLLTRHVWFPRQNRLAKIEM